MGASLISGPLGYQPVDVFGLPDTTARNQQGTKIEVFHPYWGGMTVMYARANGSIRQFGLCVCTPALSSGAYNFNMTEVPNTANLGRSLFVAMTSMTSGQYGWFLVSGLIPVNCQASVAADTAFGIAAAGQGGAIANGKQVLKGRVITAATATVAKTNCVANSGSTQLLVTNSDGWFCGIYLSGTGIAAATTVTDIDPSGRFVTLSTATTAAVNGSVTGTYNNATVFYNIAYLDHPFAQGAIT